MVSQASDKSYQRRIYDENLTNVEPIRFITARRFWLLVYMLIGSTGLAMAIARFLVRPINVRVTQARRKYNEHVQGLLKTFVNSLAKSITALPGRQIIVDTNRHRLYVNTETQTESQDPVEQEQDVTSPSTGPISLTALPQKLSEAGQQKEEELYMELTSKMSDLKSSLYQFDSFSYKSTLEGFGAGSEGDAIQKFKAEIRAVKGTMLNARTFTSTQKRTT